MLKLPPITETPTIPPLKRANGTGTKANEVTGAEEPVQDVKPQYTEAELSAERIRVMKLLRDKGAISEELINIMDCYAELREPPQTVQQIVQEAKKLYEISLNTIARTLKSCLFCYAHLMKTKVSLYEGRTLFFEPSLNFKYPNDIGRELYYGLLVEDNSSFIINLPKAVIPDPKHTKAVVNQKIEKLRQALEELRVEVNTKIEKHLELYELLIDDGDPGRENCLRNAGMEPLPRGAFEKLKGFITVTRSAIECFEEDICIEYHDSAGEFFSKFF